MDIIAIGVYNNNDKDKIDKILSNFNYIEIIWDYDDIYRLESSEGLRILKKYYNLHQLGILIESNQEDNIFSSYSLIDDVTETFLGNQTKPKLFEFLEKIEKIELEILFLDFGFDWCF